MIKNYDFVITSGGIGPTHDGKLSLPTRCPAQHVSVHKLMILDITYASLAKAFELPLAHHKETQHRMWTLASEEKRSMMENASAGEKEARNRMALFPTAEEGSSGAAKSEVLFVKPEMWVPVVRLGGKVSDCDLSVEAENV